MKSRRFHLIITLLLLVSVAIAALMQSRAVVQWLWQQVELRSEGRVSAQRIDGVLAGPITIDGLLIKTPSSEIAISSGRFDWHPGRLLAGRVSIIETVADEAVVTIIPRAKPAAPGGVDGIAAPLTLHAHALALKRLVIRKAGMDDLVFEAITVEDARWRGDRLWVDQLNGTLPWGTLQARGYLATRLSQAVDLQTRFTLNRALFDAPLEASGRIDGTFGEPHLTQTISGAASGTVNGTIRWAPGPLHWQAVADITPFSLAQLRPQWRPLTVGGQLEGSGDFIDNELRGSVTISDPLLQRWRANIALKQQRRRIEVAQLQLQGDGHAAQLAAHGTFHLANGPDYLTDADLQLRWSNVVWPVAGGEERLRSSDGTAQLRGALLDYRLSTELALEMPRYPPTRWQLEAAGDLRHLTSSALEVRGLEGTARGAATVTWSPTLTWQARLDGKGIQPHRFWPQWPGKLDIALQSSGNWETARRLEVELLALKGTLRGYPLAASGRVDFLDGRWSLAALRLASGSATLTAAGALADPWAVDFALDAPQLSHLLPQARGRLRAKGSISGSGSAPHILLDASATEAVWQQWRLRQALLDADIDLAGRHPWRLRLQTGQLQLNEQTLLERATLYGDGDASAHRIALQVARSDGQFTLAADGAWLDGQWRGTLHDGAWLASQGESWRQELPATFAAGASQQSLQPFCWQGGPARGCFAYQPAAAGGGELSATLSGLPLPLFTQWVPRKDVRFAGVVHAEGRARFDQGLREVALEARVESGALHYRHPLGGNIELLFKKWALTLQGGANGATAALDIALTNGDTLQLQGALPGWRVGTPLAGPQPVTGSATLAMRDLTWMTLVIPEILNPKGVITAQLALGGSVADPRLTGELALKDGSVAIPRAGLAIRQLALAASSPDGVSLRLAGAATSGPGWVTVEGSVRGESLDKWRSEFLLRGDRFEAVRLPSVHLLASPEIQVKIEPYRLDVAGTLRVPEATIQLPEIPTTVRTSSDVVLVNGEAADGQAARWRLNSRLTLQLGERIQLEGYGFKGRIAGQLTVTEKPESVATGQGELTVHDGSYRAYGQDLTIDYGRFLFAHSPLDNPALDVRASRSRDEVKVGVNITGRLQRPELRLFSEPAMEESDALAYLVLGRPLHTASSSEAGTVSAAATSLSLVGGDRIARAIGSEFGIDEVSVGSVYGSQEAALLLGKYLSPRLYLQYAVVFSDALNITRLRYELTNHWYIKAESGEQQAVDILYTFER